VEGREAASIFESGAILQCLAEKTGRFLPADLAGWTDALQWLYWQMGGLGPMLGQNLHFAAYAPKNIPYGIEQYVRETDRLFGVLNRRLADRAFAAGDYSIAGMARYPWVIRLEREQPRFDDFPHIRRWAKAIAGRPATIRACEKGKAINTAPTVNEDSKTLLLGRGAALAA